MNISLSNIAFEVSYVMTHVSLPITSVILNVIYQLYSPLTPVAKRLNSFALRVKTH